MARDLERLATGLRGFLPNGKDVTRVVALSTGHSNETYLVEGVNLILRMPPSEEGLLPPYDMAREHGILAAVGGWKDRPPVPKVLQLCMDPAVMGDPFFLMERLYGEAYEYSEPEWFQKATPEIRGDMCSQWVNAVAAVNRAPRRLDAGTRTSRRSITPRTGAMWQ
jgi:aminoglycoside phosphotransferase (APT) family kinase protein